MRKKTQNPVNLPTIEQVENEMQRLDYRSRLRRAITSTIYTLIVVAAATVLIAVLVMPVMHIYGDSMNPTLEEEDIVVAVKGKTFETGDVVAFYYNNKILVKRVIGKEGDWVDIDKAGNVYVNNVRLDEPYVTGLAFGECDIQLPYQVPESRIFVMGDHRDVSIDSRSSSIGCITQDEIVGKIKFRIWPLDTIGTVN